MAVKLPQPSLTTRLDKYTGLNTLGSIVDSCPELYLPIATID